MRWECPDPHWNEPLYPTAAYGALAEPVRTENWGSLTNLHSGHRVGKGRWYFEDNTWETEVSSLWIGKRGCEYSWWLLILYSTVSVCLLFEQKDLEHPILWEPSTVVISVLSCQLKSSPNWFSCTLVSIHFQLTLERWQVKYCSSLKLLHDFLCQWEQEEPTAFRVAKCWAMSGGVLFCRPPPSPDSECLVGISHKMHPEALAQLMSWSGTSSPFPLSPPSGLYSWIIFSDTNQHARKLPNQKSSRTSLIPSLSCSRLHLPLFLHSWSYQHLKFASSSPPTEVFQSGRFQLSGKQMQTWNTSSFLKRLNKGFMIRYQLPNVLLFTLEGVRCT